MVFKLLNMLDVLNYAARSSALWLRIWAGSGVTIFKSAQYAEFFPGQVKLWKNTKLTGCTQAVRLKLSKVIQGSVEKAIFSPATALTSHFSPGVGHRSCMKNQCLVNSCDLRLTKFADSQKCPQILLWGVESQRNVCSFEVKSPRTPGITSTAPTWLSP